jgi:hypothetical protein
MARNRKSHSAAIRFGPALKALLLCLLIGGSGVGYVWQKEQIANLGNLFKVRERRLNSLKDQNELLRKQLAKMRSPRFLELRIKEANLGLVPPQPAQVLRLTEPVAEPPRADQPQYAAHSQRPVLGP